MSCVETLKISDDKKKYIVDILNPILEELVTDLLKKCPDSPLEFIEEYAAKKRSGSTGASAGGSKSSDSEVIALKEEISVLKKKMSESAQMVSNLKGVNDTLISSKSHDNLESEESEDDDDDELPEEMQYIKSDAQQGRSRASVSAEAYGSWNMKKEFVAKVIAKTDQQKARIREVLGSSFMFSALDEKEMSVVVDAMSEVIAEVDETLIEQGDDGDFLFVIETGKLDCVKKTGDVSAVVKTCEAGDVFGELALLYNCPRAASVVAKEKCSLWKLDRDTFNSIVKDAAAKKRNLYETFLSNTPLLAPVAKYELSQIADAIKVETCESGVVVVKEKDPGDKFYIVEEGALDVTISGATVMKYNTGDYFGELALMNNQPRNATVTTTATTRLLTLDRRSFKRLLGPLEELLKKNMGKYHLES